MGLRVMNLKKKKLQTMGLKVREKNIITNFSLIKITKVYNDIFFRRIVWVYEYPMH
jgi:hypothetical protein